MPYSGDLSRLPNGWALCDGKNGNPDLRGRFLIGAGDFIDVFGKKSYSLKDYGGERLHQLTINEMPTHNHNGLLKINFYGNNDSQGDLPVGGTWWGTNYSTEINMTTSANGGNQPHENIPPYFSVNWIIKK